MAQKPVNVTVNPGVDITVDVDKVNVSKKDSDTIAWKATTNNQQFTIKFPPNEKTPISCNWQGSKWVCTAGPFDGSNRTFKYDVEASGTPTLDPDIEIQT